MDNLRPLPVPGPPLAADGRVVPARRVPPGGPAVGPSPGPARQRNPAWLPVALSVVLHVLVLGGVVFAVRREADALRPTPEEKARAAELLPAMALSRGEALPNKTRDLQSLFVAGKEMADGTSVFQSRIAETSASMVAKVEALPLDNMAMPPADEVIPGAAVEQALAPPPASGASSGGRMTTPGKSSPGKASASGQVGGKGGARGSAMAPPKLVAAPAPAYPSAERAAGHAGVVAVRVLVRPDGTAGETALFHGCGFPALDAAAVKAARRWTFSPWDARGGPATFPVVVTVTFKQTS